MRRITDWPVSVRGTAWTRLAADRLAAALPCSGKEEAKRT